MCVCLLNMQFYPKPWKVNKESCISDFYFYTGFIFETAVLLEKVFFLYFISLNWNIFYIYLQI